MAFKKAADFFCEMRYEVKMISSGDGHDDSDDPLGDDSNVIPLKVPRTKDKKEKPPKEPSEPMFNMPPYTKYILGILVGIHIVVAVLLNKDMTHWVMLHLGFIPGRFTGAALFEPLALITPFTHMVLHGSWLHIAMNGVMLLAFGSGIERWMGGKKMMMLFVISGFFGLAAHFALNFNSIYPVVGASGGISGLFAAALIMINKMQGGVQKIWPFVLLWIGISVVFGFMGSPDGGQVAWAAHIGGFLGGFVVMRFMRI